MANEIEIKIPDIGGANQVDVIEILVHVGETIAIDTPLITLESDKASMEIPSSKAGVVTNITVKVGDKVCEGDTILLVKTEEILDETKKTVIPNTAESNKAEIEEPFEAEKPNVENSKYQTLEILIPDIGGAIDVDVIDILVKSGMQVEKDQALVTLEGDKATMDIPSPYSGTVKEVKIKLGDKVSQGTAILILETMSSQDNRLQPKPSATAPSPVEQFVKVSEQAKSEFISTDTEDNLGIISAGPAVRRMARELGVSLSIVKGSGRKARITKEDVQAYVKERLNERQVAGNFSLPGNPVIDFSKFGEIETKPLNKIKKLTGVNVHRSWITIPHVTQFDEADITDLDAFRKSESEHATNAGYKLTILAFVCRVVSKALHIYPQFNSSLDATGEHLIFKKYCNLGIAVETPNGLVVPVIKQVDTLSVGEIALEMARLSSKARDKGLMPGDMSGGCFTISSLGGIGGTAFTPIVNSPEVAILGLSRSAVKPVFDNETFKPRLMLPLSLSYDHRVIDGAEATRFTRYICDALSDIRRILL